MPYQPCSLTWKKKHQGRFQSSLFVMDQKILPAITPFFGKSTPSSTVCKAAKKNVRYNPLCTNLSVSHQHRIATLTNNMGYFAMQSVPIPDVAVTQKDLKDQQLNRLQKVYETTLFFLTQWCVLKFFKTEAWGRKLFAGVNLCYKELNSQTDKADLLHISSSPYKLLAVINS